MANFQTIPQSDWRSFFDAMSKSLLGKWAEIEVASLDLGDQIVAEWIPLAGITYDSGDDLLDVSLGRGNQLVESHFIRHPREIVVDMGAVGIESVAVTDADGEQQVIRLKEPLKVAAAGGRSTAT